MYVCGGPINLYVHVIHFPLFLAFFLHARLGKKELLVPPLTQLVLTDDETPTHQTF